MPAIRLFAIATAIVLGLNTHNPVMAGAASGTFAVHISMQGYSGICTSQSLSQAASAIVRVVCATGQFVSIEADPAKPFLGVHGGAYRFNFVGALARAQDGYGDLTSSIDAGTVTALRILNASDGSGPIELLISF